MCNIHKDRILFEIFLWKKKKKKKKKMNETELFRFGFLNLVKG